MDPILITAVFVMTVAAVMLVGLLGSAHRGQLARRLSGGVQAQGELEGYGFEQFATSVIPKIAVPLVPQNPEEQERLNVKLIQAGYYGDSAVPIFLGVKMALLILLVLVGLVATVSGAVSPTVGLFLTAFGGILGLRGPNYWLQIRKRDRQASLRRALPDALDMVVVCMEGGISLDAALQKVARELTLAHPLLATELMIVNRATELGQSLSEALQQFAGRFDLAELRALRSLVTESQRFGSSVGQSLRVHAETLREERRIHAEEAARKAVVTMLFPTALFILPTIFLVVLAPSLIRIYEVLSEFKFTD